MRYFLPLLAPLLIGSFVLPAQVPDLDKPPQDVDDALRARITKFYDLHVQRKYRQAESLIAEESKDDFYVLSKPELEAFQIGKVEYSENFTLAKVVIVGKMLAMLPMFGGKMMDIPFASYWKIEDGKWCWYFNKVASRHTPFGDVKEPADSTKRETPSSLPSAAPITLEGLQSAVRLERTTVDLVAGTPQRVTVKNTLGGPVSLTIDGVNQPLAQAGISASFDKAKVNGGESAVLELKADSSATPGAVTLRITVSPTNQVLDLIVNVKR